MRDPGRIYMFSNKLALLWATQVPDWRFGQLVENVFSMIRGEGRDPFFLEENELLSYFEKYLEANEPV